MVSVTGATTGYGAVVMTSLTSAEFECWNTSNCVFP